NLLRRRLSRLARGRFRDRADDQPERRRNHCRHLRTITMVNDPNSFEGKIAWITGCGRGMGRAHAELMASRGADIVVHDVLEEEAAATAEAVRAMGRR